MSALVTNIILCIAIKSGWVVVLLLLLMHLNPKNYFIVSFSSNCIIIYRNIQIFSLSLFLLLFQLIQLIIMIIPHSVSHSLRPK